MLVVECPKRYADSNGSEQESYAYYAGYSLNFASRLLEHAPLDEDALVMDPWNGSGTTTLAASQTGYRSFGTDLNPVMLVVAKARLLRQSTLPSVEPIWKKIKLEAKLGAHTSDIEDPLGDWFSPKGASAIRRLENAVRGHLTSADSAGPISGSAVNDLSDIAAFFYVSLFRVVRGLIGNFQTSNPTWLRRAKTTEEKISIDFHGILSLVENDLHARLFIVRSVETSNTSDRGESSLRLSNSEQLDISDSSIDLVLTSPPYCTRIDYAVATSVELAVLGFARKLGFSELRDSLMGTTTVPKIAPIEDETWGPTCLQLLQAIRSHKSVASNTYYLKNHLRYFSSLSKSISEIARILKPNGIATFVVQDSQYKDVHNDLAQIVSEMTAICGMTEFQRDDFNLGASIGSINSRSRAYKPSGFKPTESVVSFYKNP